MSEESDKKKRGILCVLSVILFIAGFLIALSVLFILFGGAAMSGDASTIDPSVITKQAGSAVLIICALLTIFTGLMGCCVQKAEEKGCKCFMWVFGCSIGATSMFVFIIGVIFASTASWMPASIGAFCTPKSTTTKWQYQKVSIMDTGMLDLNNENMCTSTCPCNATDYAAGYTSMPSANFTFQGRSKSQAPTDGTKSIALGGGKTYSTMLDCLNGPVTAANSNDQQLIAKYQSYFQFMKPLEKQSNCSGWCTNALFWFTKPITTAPNTACISYIAATAGTGYTIPGTITIIAGIIMFLIFLFQYTMWCNKSDPTWGN